MRYAQNDPIDCRNAEGKSRLLYKISANLPDGFDTVALAHVGIGDFLKNANKLTIIGASNAKVLSRTYVPIENAGRLGTWNNRGCRPVQKPQRTRRFRPLSFRPGIPAFPGRSPVSGSEISFFLNVPRVGLRVRPLSAPFSRSTSGKEGFEKSPMERRFRLKPLFPMLPFRSSLTSSGGHLSVSPGTS